MPMEADEIETNSKSLNIAGNLKTGHKILDFRQMFGLTGGGSHQLAVLISVFVLLCFEEGRG